MKTCFVIQRFDSGIYDKRYRETFAPAIERGGAKPVRADEVLGTKPVVEKIEQNIRSADVAFAEVSEDNPNVFLELGYALSLGIPTIIVCDKSKRSQLPFDIAHRPVNFYVTHAQSDYENIAEEIEQGISAALLEEKVKESPRVPENQRSSIDDVKGACLLELLDQSLRSPIGNTVWQIQKELASDGISGRMAALAIASLLEDGLIEQHKLVDENGDPYNSFALSDHGQKHLLRSYSSLMKDEKDRATKAAASSWKSKSTSYDDLEDDIPF